MEAAGSGLSPRSFGQESAQLGLRIQKHGAGLPFQSRQIAEKLNRVSQAVTASNDDRSPADRSAIPEKVVRLPPEMVRAHRLAALDLDRIRNLPCALEIPIAHRLQPGVSRIESNTHQIMVQKEPIRGAVLSFRGCMSDYSPLLLRYRKLPDHHPLKIGIVLDRHAGPLWVRDLIDYLKGVPQFELSILLAGEAQRTPSALPWLADRLHATSKRKYDSFREVDFGLGTASRVLRKPGRTVNALHEAARTAIEERKLDMVLWLADAMPAGPCVTLARFGVFSVQLSDGRSDPPYWREVIEGQPVSCTALLWHATSFERARQVYTAETSTQQDWAFTKNAEEPLIAVRRMLATVGLELLTDARSWLAGALELPEVEPPTINDRTPVSTTDSVRFIAKQAKRSARIRMQRGKLQRWFLAVRRHHSEFYTNLGRFSPSNFEELPLRGTHMADPFVITDKRRTWLFYEYVPLGAQKGRLGCMAISHNARPSKPEIVLQKDYHLSYPCVFSHRGEYFMIPESSADRTVQLYRATKFPFEFKFEANLVEGLSAVDTTPFFHNGHWFFFTTTTEPFLETFLFWSDSLSGKWQLHPISPISSSVRNTRGAGHLFYQRGRLLRPAQDCSVRYGYGITINQINRLSPTEFEEERVDHIAPNWRPGLLGTHTLNANAEFEVIDGIRYQE